MQVRRGKYWQPNPIREQKASEKRERRCKRNVLQAFRQDKSTKKVR